MRKILLSSVTFFAMTSFSLAEPTGLTDQVAVAMTHPVVLSDAEMAGITAGTSVYYSTVINAPVDRVWAVVREFSTLPRWFPIVASTRVANNQPADRVGVARDVILRDGTIVRERLLALSDIDRFYSYTYRETALPVTNFVSTVQLRPITDGNRTFIEGRAQFDSPTEQQAQQVANQLRVGVYQPAFRGLQALFSR